MAVEKNGKKSLYPLVFEQEAIEFEWGSETWMLADLGVVDSTVKGGWLGGNSMSDIMETYMERISGEDAFAWCGRQFPLMVRKLDINGELPPSVAPDDTTASERYDSLGGSKAWLVTKASEDALIWLGVSRQMDASEAYSLHSQGLLKSALKAFHPHEGDLIHIHPGQIFGAKGPISVIEIAESANLDFEIESNFEEVLDFVSLTPDGGARVVANAWKESRVLLESEEFNISCIRLNGESPVTISEDNESFCVAICMDGKACIKCEASDTEELDTNALSLIPADCAKVTIAAKEEIESNGISAGVGIIVATVSRSFMDEYINPDTEAFLEGEDYEGLNSGDEDEEVL